METISQIVLRRIQETKDQFFAEVGKNCEDEKRLFVNWYIERCNAPLKVLINDLSDYYLHITEDTIIKYLNEKRS